MGCRVSPSSVEPNSGHGFPVSLFIPTSNYRLRFLCLNELFHKFVTYYSKFDWENDTVGVKGPKHSLMSDYEIDIIAMYLTKESESEGNFERKHINIQDPLNPSNNLGTSIPKGNISKIKKRLEAEANILIEFLEGDKDVNDYPLS